MPAADIAIITYTLKYISKEFSFPKTITEDYLQQAIGDTISIMRDPQKKLNLLSYGDARKNGINQISHIFQRSTAQTRIKFLPLPSILPQSQNENLQPPEITSIPAPDPRVEQISQPPRVKKILITHTASKREAFNNP